MSGRAGIPESVRSDQHDRRWEQEERKARYWYEQHVDDRERDQEPAQCSRQDS